MQKNIFQRRFAREELDFKNSKAGAAQFCRRHGLQRKHSLIMRKVQPDLFCGGVKLLNGRNKVTQCGCGKNIGWAPQLLQ